MGTGSQLDIIVPARNEHGGIEACLNAALASGPGLDLRVIVVANGPGWERTLEAAAQCRPQFDAAGAELRLIGQSEPGKARALNHADRFRRGCTVAYLDADVELQPNSLRIVYSALEGSAPRLAAPRMILLEPKCWLARNYARLWSALPGVAGQLIGTGVYVVNPPGRARWDEFPLLIADDAFVRSRFHSSERLVCEEAEIAVAFPDWPHLLTAVRRWRDGCRQLSQVRALSSPEASSDPGAGWRANLRFLFRRPDLWPHVPWFLLVRGLASLVREPAAEGHWLPERSGKRRKIRARSAA